MGRAKRLGVGLTEMWVQVDPNGWHAAGGGGHSLATGITSAAGWGLETILTATLVFIVFCATDAERGSDTAHLPVRIQHVPPLAAAASHAHSQSQSHEDAAGPD